MSTDRIAAVACAMGTLIFAGLMSIWSTPATADPPGDDDGPPDYIRLTGLVRDFRERTAEGGHPDFERRPDHGMGHYVGNIAPDLGPDRRPMFIGLGGKVSQQWRDSEGRPICYLLYDPGRGDQEGAFGGADPGGIDSIDSFFSWYHDIPGVNMSKLLTLTLVRQEDGTYVFDDKLDPRYVALGGFFPIEDDLFGNPGGQPDRNFHFTFELHTEFVYDAAAVRYFKFAGDDDVWVFVDNRLVIDLGGVHGAREQCVDLDRLGLEDGETYRLDFFFAERHRSQSNFRIVTNLMLENTHLPTVSAIFD